MINGPMSSKEKAGGLVKQGHLIRPKQGSEQTCSVGWQRAGMMWKKTQVPWLLFLPRD